VGKRGSPHPPHGHHSGADPGRDGADTIKNRETRTLRITD
jgi:hypothetical protein